MRRGERPLASCDGSDCRSCPLPRVVGAYALGTLSWRSSLALIRTVSVTDILHSQCSPPLSEVKGTKATSFFHGAQ
jgi:hypothetical protein